jgi:hypothetical protein
MPSHMNFDPPSPVAIARELCGMTDALKSDVENYERFCLESAHKFLSDEPPNIAAAKAKLDAAVAHAFRELFGELDRPESWLAAAAARLLSGV